MSHKALARIVVRSIEYFELIGDDELDPHTAVKHIEDISADLAAASADEQAAVKAEARSQLAWYDRTPGEHEWAPKLSPQHRSLLKNIATGQPWGRLDGAT